VRVLSRYYLREFVKLFVVMGFGLSLVLGAIDLISRMGTFLPHDPRMVDLLYYALLTAPRYFLYLMPVAALVCSLYVIGHASRTREMVAVMASGGRVRRLLLPFVILGVFLSLLGFVMEEFVVPAFSTEAIRVKHAIRKRAMPSSVMTAGGIWLRAGDGSLVKIDFYLEEEDTFRGMSIFVLGEEGMGEVVRAGEARYLKEEKAWLLSDVTRYNLATYETTSLASYHYPHLGPPSVFAEEVRKPYALGIREIKRYLDRLERAGFRNLRLLVEFHSKLSYPLVSFFMVLIGVSISSRRTMGGLAATGVGLLMTLAYWMAFTMLLSFGYTGILPPFVAAWLMPLLMGGLSGYLFLRIPE
jgi:lipopolysaccharide export system permease protein